MQNLSDRAVTTPFDHHILQRLTESDFLGIFYWSLEGAIHEANDTFLQMVGYSRDELYAGCLNWMRMTPPEYLPETEELLSLLRRTGQGPLVEKEYFHKDGRRIPVMGGGVMIQDGGTEGIAFVIDITRSKTAEAELRFVLTHAQCLLWFGTVVARRNGDLEWHTYVFDDAHAQSFCPLDLYPEERYTQAWYRHRLPEGQVLTDGLSVRSLQQNHRVYKAEFGVRNRFGKIQWFDEKVHVDPLPRTPQGEERWRVVGVCMDITERRQASQLLKSALEKEQQIARTLQRSLLQAPPPDAFPGIRIKLLYEPAQNDAALSGDFVDVFSINEDLVALVVGDATGKGLDAASYTVQVKYALRAFLRDAPEPAEALKRLNNFLVDAARYDWGRVDHTYVVASVATLHIPTGTLCLSSAGMEPPFIYRPDTGEATMLSSGGLMLGVEPQVTYDQDRITIRAGDLFVMTTDGITEAFNGTHFFGYDGLLQILRQYQPGTQTLSALMREIGQQAGAFVGGPMKDDVCLMLARFDA